MNRLLRSVIVAGLALGLAACSGTGANEATGTGEFAQFKELILAHEDAIADCMQAKGFAYVAHLPPDAVREEAAVMAELRGEDPVKAMSAASPAPDPNEEVVTALSESEQEAWAFAYWGEETEAVPGCYHETYEAVWGASAFESDAEVDRTVDRIRADHRVLAAERDYVGCMHEAGYADVENLYHIFQFIEEHEEGIDEAVRSAQGYSDWSLTAQAEHERCLEAYNQTYNSVYVEYFEE